MADKFEFEYQAPTQEQRKEIQGIQKKYLDQSFTNDKLNRLKTLDSKVKSIPEAIGISQGVIGVLIFGTGLTCILEWNLYVVGIIVMLLGSIIAVLAYFIYNIVKNKLKNKYKDEIISLSNELLNGDK